MDKTTRVLLVLYYFKFMDMTFLFLHLIFTQFNPHCHQGLITQYDVVKEHRYNWQVSRSVVSRISQRTSLAVVNKKRTKDMGTQSIHIMEKVSTS